MKETLLLLFTLAALQTAKAQIAPEKLFGTWTLIKYDYGNGNTGDQTKAAFRKIKIFTAQTVTTLSFNRLGSIDSAGYASYRANEHCCVLVGTPVPGFGVVVEEPIGNTGNKKADKSFYTANIDSAGFLHATTKEYVVDPAVGLTVANRDQ